MIDLELLWENVTEEYEETLLSEACKTCENDKRACYACEWECDNTRNVVYRTHYWNSEIEV